MPFSKTLLIERADFMEIPEKKYFRLTPGQEVRLRWGYFVTCTGCKKDAAGNVTEVTCTYDPATRGGDAPDGRKVKGTLHWVSAQHAVAAGWPLGGSLPLNCVLVIFVGPKKNDPQRLRRVFGGLRQLRDLAR